MDFLKACVWGAYHTGETTLEISFCSERLVQAKDISYWLAQYEVIHSDGYRRL